MTREEAKEILSDFNLCHYTPSREAAEAIISALDPSEIMSALGPRTQEQMERVWTHCEHCADGKSVDGQIILCGNRGLFSMNFCPICGAPLRDKAWEEMMERLEALNDAD